MQQLLVDRAAEIGRIDSLLAHLLTSGIINGYIYHACESMKL
jgi:hypothetical protein